MTNIAVILAGGSGHRIGGGIPKQLLPLADGKSILEHAINAFEIAPCIHQIGVVMHKDYITQAQALVQRNGWHKVAWIIPGGNERWQSSVNAITKIQEDINNQLRINQLINNQQGNNHLNNTQPITDEESVNIILHDAARPFVTKQIIQDVCTALTRYQAVTVALPATDTIYRITPDQTIAEIPPRQTIMYAQTPQAFRLTTISEAYHKALQDSTQPTKHQHASPTQLAEHLQATDDCGIVHQYLPNIPIHIVLGAPSNRKITYPEDLNK